MTAPQSQAVLDSVAAQLGVPAPDTTATDTAFDTTSVLAEFAEDAARASEALGEGDVATFGAILYESLVESFVNFLPLLFKALVILAVLFLLYRFTHSVLDHTFRRTKRVDEGLHSILLKTFRAVAIAFIAVVFVDQLGFNVTALLAGLSIVGIAVGFAARDTLENFIAGATLLLDRPFRVGDNIDIEGVYGSVEEITLRSTRLRTLNNTVLVMPNTHMITTKLINHSLLGAVRVDVEFGIGYDEQPEEVRTILLELLKGDTRIDEDYPPRVDVEALGASSIDMALKFYIKNPSLEYYVRWQYLEKVREALREADIEIPFPHLQVMLDEAKALEETALRVVTDGGRQTADRH